MTSSNGLSLHKQDTSFIRLHALDNCAVATKRIAAGVDVIIEGESVCKTQQAIPPGHKIAIADIGAASPVIKYGWPIGVATEAIPAGAWIHSHNLRNDHNVDLSNWTSATVDTSLPNLSHRTFEGYHRPNGSVGTRNYIAVISTVNCSASVARWSAARFDSDRLQQVPNVDGVIAIRHETGCGMAYEGQKHKMLERVLSGIAKHANVGGAIIIGLGCEQATTSHLMEHGQLVQLNGLPTELHAERDSFPVLNIQQAGGTRAAIAAIDDAVTKMLPIVNEHRRRPTSISQLRVGLKCGGSDGYSGITANPALGYASDLIVAAGGTTVLGETTEVYGAEHLLFKRARSKDVATALHEKLQWWEWYAGLFGEEMDHNPSTGNKAGGLTTIAEKSLGAVSKSGQSILNDVIDYAAPIRTSGLVLMDSPGFDPACVTGMMASGCNVIVFTTGRGSCFGSKPVPSIKVATNSFLFQKMNEDMDFDSGRILSGQSLQANGTEMLDMIIDVASGTKTKSELLGYGDDEFIPWTVGATL
jgi:altronate hydrolase